MGNGLSVNKESAASAMQLLRQVAPDEVVAGLGPLSVALRNLSVAPELDLKRLGAMTAPANSRSSLEVAPRLIVLDRGTEGHDKLVSVWQSVLSGARWLR